MTLTPRDKKIVMLLVPLALVAAYWFLLLAPKREESAKVKDELAQAQSQRDAAVGKAAQLDQAKRGFGDDYATVVRLGKALPTSVDMPSLMVQLDRAARGTGIDFEKIATGDREGAVATTPSASSGANGSGGNAGAGGQPAQTGAGQTVESANNAAAAANGQAGAAGAGGSGAPGGAGVAGLESVPLDFEFTGSFFDLADFFHRMKRFVRVANDQVVVRGRLITIDSFKFTAGDDFPALNAEVQATVYLAPRAQGTTAGASPSGPAPAPGGSPAGQTASTSTPPTATATP